MADNINVFPDLQAIARALGGVVSGGQVLAPGPGHSAADRSLSVKPDAKAPDGFVVYSFAADDPIVCRDYVRGKIGLPAFKPNGRGYQRPPDDVIQRAVMAAAMSQGYHDEPKGRITKVYDYTDADGGVLYQVVRYDPKDFRQRRPDGTGGFVWNLDSIERVPYKLAELLKFPLATVFVCEGEKDADRVASLEHCATTVAGGKWTDECVQALSGRDIIILEDNDNAGRATGLATARILRGTAKTIRIVSLPSLPDKGDVSDWLDADPGNAKKFGDICLTVPEWTPDAAAPDADTIMPAGKTAKPPPQRHPLPFVNMSTWDDDPVPEYDWAVPDRYPLRQTSLFSGEGAVGKSIVKLQLAVAHVLRRDWFGTLPD